MAVHPAAGYGLPRLASSAVLCALPSLSWRDPDMVGEAESAAQTEATKASATATVTMTAVTAMQAVLPVSVGGMWVCTYLNFYYYQDSAFQKTSNSGPPGPCASSSPSTLVEHVEGDVCFSVDSVRPHLLIV